MSKEGFLVLGMNPALEFGVQRRGTAFRKSPLPSVCYEKVHIWTFFAARPTLDIKVYIVPLLCYKKVYIWTFFAARPTLDIKVYIVPLLSLIHI